MARVGGDVDAFCTRCGLLLGHTVIAMVRSNPVKVRCNTCHTVHPFRGGGAATRPPRERPRAAGFDELLRARDVARARRYSPRETYAEGQVLDHPQFGRGFVSALREAGKLEVTFRGGVKTLVHGRGER
ncbi:MAG TPA: hypothetical protein VFR85_13000 [Anaeromyxobacteraceae bacterium]|nr:hypothetical protein [Anaeromyxobacteraceae bacterium]